MKYFALLLLLLPVTLTAQVADNMDFLGQWEDVALAGGSGGVNRYSDVWGYARGGREYALLGSRAFIHVLDVTDPANITEISRLNTYTNSTSTWRDIKVYDDYAYCVTETGEGLQVIDLTGLPASAAITHVNTDDFTRCHNIFIDSLSSPAKLYMFGTEGGAERNGYIVYSLANPAVPTLVASTDLGRYIHDGFVIRDTLYANQGNAGMRVYDLADPVSPIEIGTLTQYRERGYNHSSWRTENGNYLVLCDETFDRGVKVIDVRDPLDMMDVGLFRSTLLQPTTGSTSSLAHNPYVVGDSIVVISYYGDGVQVWNIGDPARPYRIGYYDTTPNSTSYGGGVWGAYPWLPSGNILASDQRNGLFVVAVQQFFTLPVEYTSWDARAVKRDAHLTWSTGVEEDNAGFVIEHAGPDGHFRELTFLPADPLGQYAFTHEAPGPGHHYYRLRQRDFDGTESVSEVRAVTFAEAAGTFTVFPNPAPAGTPLSLRGLAADTPWELFGVDGKRVLAGRGTVLREEVPTGVYALRAEGYGVVRVVVR